MRFNPVIHIWQSLRGVTIWVIWIPRNAKACNSEQWTEDRIKELIWQGILLGYSKIAWANTVKGLERDDKGHSQSGFDVIWARRKIICSREDRKVTWQFRVPNNVPRQAQLYTLESCFLVGGAWPVQAGGCLCTFVFAMNLLSFVSKNQIKINVTN